MVVYESYSDIRKRPKYDQLYFGHYYVNQHDLDHNAISYILFIFLTSWGRH